MLKYELNHKSPSLKPRGLKNRSNWCFVNAILQALIVCPPFYNFFKSVPVNEAVASGAKVEILKAVWNFVREFEVMTNFPKLNRRDKNKKELDLPLGSTLEASSVLDMLLSLNKTDTFNVVEGRQEDAEEFLTYLLNGLNDEIIAAIKTEPENEQNEGEEKDDEGKFIVTKNIKTLLNL